MVVPLFYGDVVDILTSQSAFRDEARERDLRHSYGLDQPVIVSWQRFNAFAFLQA